MSEGHEDPRNDATAATRAANAALAASLPFEDRRDFEEAARGLIAPLPYGGVIRAADGRPVWDLSRFSFIEQGAPAPDTVNPSLWRQSQLVVQGGLYEVVPGLYQVRTADVSNITFAEGDEAATRCTTSTRSGARRSGIRWRGRSIWSRRSTCGATARR